MRLGDLDNSIAPAVAFRFENVIYLYGQIDQGARAALEYNMFQRDCNVYILTLMSQRKVMAKCLKWAVPYTRVIQVDSALEIPEICKVHRILEYYDRDEKILENVGTTGFQTKATKWTSPGDFSPNSSMKTG